MSIESNDFNTSQNSYNMTNRQKKSEMIKEKYDLFKKFIENNTKDELNAARNFMFRTSIFGKSSKPTTAGSNVERPTASSRVKDRNIQFENSHLKVRLTTPDTRPNTNPGTHKDKLRDFYGIPDKTPKTAVNKKRHKILSPEPQPPTPLECLKTVRDARDYNEYEESQREREKLIQLKQESKEKYTIRKKHLNSKILNFEKVKDLFKKEELKKGEANDMSSSQSDSNNHLDPEEEKRRKFKEDKQRNLKRQYSKLQENLGIFTQDQKRTTIAIHRSETNSLDSEDGNGHKTTKNRPMKGFEKIKRAALKIKAEKLTKHFLKDTWDAAKINEMDKFKMWKSKCKIIIKFSHGLSLPTFPRLASI